MTPGTNLIYVQEANFCSSMMKNNYICIDIIGKFYSFPQFTLSFNIHNETEFHFCILFFEKSSSFLWLSILD